ncbi:MULTISPECIES: hypothetical protein, partial [Klebsiella]|uniref:hypothetical protein n=1 Tax=Klebsiella TaxID=570 RepID=UPI00223F7968
SAQIREILISESAWEEMTCLFAPSLKVIPYLISGGYTSYNSQNSFSGGICICTKASEFHARI